MKNLEEITILNVPIANLTKEELLERLQSGVVFTPNVDHLVKLQEDPEFFEIYNKADYRICDSKILFYASRFLGHPLKEKISGSDFFPAFCQYHQRNDDIRIFLLGAAEGVASKAQKMINARIGRLIVVGSYSPSFGFEKNEKECFEIIDRINQSGATVLAVGVGAPKQEKWIYRYKHLLPYINIFLAIGATIDFEAGQKNRAPQWMSEVGFEWMYRLITEPRRLWKRYLIEDTHFFWLLLKQKLNFYQCPITTIKDTAVSSTVNTMSVISNSVKSSTMSSLNATNNISTINSPISSLSVSTSESIANNQLPSKL